LFLLFLLSSINLNIEKMKIAARILSLLIIVGLAIFSSQCKGKKDDDKSQEEQQLTKLNGVWSLSSANDGTDRTADFPGLKLTLSGNFAKGGVYDYSFTGKAPNPSPWPQTGTWKFGADVTKDIIRDAGSGSEISATYTVTDAGLAISFTLPSGHVGWAGFGRTASVAGNWTFEFTK
jgi:hypothetical protein